MPLHLLPPGGLTSTAILSHGPLTRVFSLLPLWTQDPLF